MNNMEQFLKTTITEAGTLAMGYFRGELKMKTKSSPADYVTEADEAVSAFVVGKIQDKYPDHHIHSEELPEDINPGAQYEWVIDPIDGTRNFAFGIPFWGIIIALVKDGETLMGAVYNPLAGELFFAEKGKGAYLNDRQIHVNNTEMIDHSFATFSRATNEGVYGEYIERFRVANIRLVQETEAWIHNYGSAVAICYLASGGIDFCSGNAGMDWDFLAPFLICEEAGAVVTDSEGSPWKRGRQDYVVANKYLHPKVMELFRPI